MRQKRTFPTYALAQTFKCRRAFQRKLRLPDFPNCLLTAAAAGILVSSMNRGRFLSSGERAYLEGLLLRQRNAILLLNDRLRRQGMAQPRRRRHPLLARLLAAGRRAGAQNVRLEGR